MANDEKNMMDALTDEERAAIGEEGLEDTEAEAGDEGVEETAKESAAETEAQASETDEAEELADPILPPLRARAPENIEEIITAISSEEDALAQKFDDGDITAREYRDGLNRLNAQRDELNWNKRKADLAREMEDTAKANAWQKEVSDFMTTTAAHITKSHAAMIAFDDVVKKVTSDPANLNLSDRAQLDKAYKIFMNEVGEAFGIQPQQSQQTKATAPAPKAARNIPPTLAKVPASDMEDLDGGKFAALDRLAAADPVAYESAVAKMSEAERAQYESVM